MRILYCIPTLEHGGAERQLGYLAAEMIRRGHDVHVASTRGGANGERLLSSGVTIHRVAGRGNHDPRIFVHLVRLIARLKPDVIQTTVTQMDILGGMAALLTRTPWLLRESNSAAAYPRSWKNGLRRALAARADAIVANSEQGAGYWRGADARRCSVIRNGVPSSGVAPASVAPYDAGIQPSAKVVLFIGRLEEPKNVRTLIHAFASLRLTGDVRLLIAGDGSQRRDLERLAAAAGVRERTLFTGFVDDVRPLLARAAVLVSLSSFEGCPNVVLEAMAAGCPLLLSDIAAHREILDDESATFVDGHDAGRVAVAITAILMNPAASRARALAAQARAGEWSLAATAGLYENLYFALVDR